MKIVKRLPKELQLEILEEVFDRFQKERSCEYLCNELILSMEKRGIIADQYFTERETKLFPALQKTKPDSCYEDYPWFPSSEKEKRIECLLIGIKFMRNEKRKGKKK